MKVKVVSLCCFLLWGLSISGVLWAEDDESEPVVVQYHNLKPSFVANFSASSTTKKLKFLKADVSVRASSGVAINEVMNHDALVRHAIVMLLSRTTEKTLSTSGGQEEVRKAALEAVKAVLKEETGKEQIDDLLFTSFVVQR